MTVQDHRRRPARSQLGGEPRAEASDPPAERERLGRRPGLGRRADPIGVARRGAGRLRRQHPPRSRGGSPADASGSGTLPARAVGGRRRGLPARPRPASFRANCGARPASDWPGPITSSASTPTPPRRWPRKLEAPAETREMRRAGGSPAPARGVLRPGWPARSRQEATRSGGEVVSRSQPRRRTTWPGTGSCRRPDPPWATTNGTSPRPSSWPARRSTWSPARRSTATPTASPSIAADASPRPDRPWRPTSPLGKGHDGAWDLFPLAMCQHRLGDPRAARDSYDKAVAWTKGARRQAPGRSPRTRRPPGRGRATRRRDELNRHWLDQVGCVSRRRFTRGAPHLVVKSCAKTLLAISPPIIMPAVSSNQKWMPR